MLGAATVMGLASAILYFVLGQPWQWLGMIAQVVWAMVLIFLAYLTARRGHLTATVYLATLGILPTTFVGPALIEGIAVAGVMAGVTLIVFARLLAGRTQNNVVVTLSALGITAGVLLSGFQVFELLPVSPWLYATLNVAVADMVIVLVGIILDSRDARYEESLAQAEVYATQLDAQRATLEQRSHDLARRARYLEATAAVARYAALELDVRELLSRVVTSVSEQFGFYHTGLFFLEPSGEGLALQAASSEGGQHMLERGHRLRVGEGIVGYAAQHRQYRLALDVGEDAVFFDNPDLPETRSEVALPLQARGEVIGVLDVQSTEPQAFSDEDIAALEALADQVAVALSNARLFWEAQQALEAERRAYGEVGREGWQRLLRARRDLGYRYAERAVSPVGEAGPGDGVRGYSDGDGEGLPGLSLPIRHLGQKLGTLVAHKPAEAGEWTPQETGLMETLAEQLSLALDSARLYEDTQRRAARERLVGEVTAHMREPLLLEDVLQTAVGEIRQALGLDELVVRLKSSDRTAGAERQSDSGDEDERRG
jgi:GAF domain-containing protein